MALINQNSIIGVTSITSPSASNVLTVHTNDTTERLRVSTSGVSFSGANASLDTSGNISAVDGTFSGNVSIGGVLTYEDVTNVDSIGIVTARNGLHVTSGNLGVGLNNPSAPLHLSGPAEIRLNNATDAGNFARIRCFEESSDNGAHLAFNTGAGEVVRFRNDGNVGIGSDDPQNSLHINGASPAIRFSDTGANGSAFSIIEDNNGLLKVRNDAGNSGSGSGIAFEVDAAERLRITSGGNIGIGTTNPGSKLAVHGSITESTDGVTYYPVVTQQDVGLDQNQIPLNQNLGGMAYMDTSNYEQVFEIPATDVTSYFKGDTEDIWIGMEGHAPSSVAWPSGSLNQIDVWEIDFQLTYPNLTSGRNDLWMLLYYHNGSTITTANSVEWNNWVLARTSYAGTNTGWNQIQSAVGTNWGKIANYMDTKLFSGQIRYYRGGTNDFTGSNAGQRTGVMWQFNYTHGGIGSTLAFGSAHPTTPSPSQPLAGFKLNADPENAGTVDSNGNSQVFGGYIRQRGFRLQGNI